MIFQGGSGPLSPPLDWRMGKPHKNDSTHNTKKQKEQFGQGLHCFLRTEYTQLSLLLEKQPECLLFQSQLIKNKLFVASLCSNQYRPGRVYDLCVYFMMGAPKGSTESGSGEAGNPKPILTNIISLLLGEPPDLFSKLNLIQPNIIK